MREDYTNGFGYFDPTATFGIQKADMHRLKPAAPKERRTEVLREKDIERMDTRRKAEIVCGFNDTHDKEFRQLCALIQQMVAFTPFNSVHIKVKDADGREYES